MNLLAPYRDEICVIFTGCPINVAGSAPAFGVTRARSATLVKKSCSPQGSDVAQRPSARQTFRPRYRDEICVIFTGCPINVAGSAPDFGVNFCVRPPNVSAA